MSSVQPEPTPILTPDMKRIVSNSGSDSWPPYVRRHAQSLPRGPPGSGTTSTLVFCDLMSPQTVENLGTNVLWR